MFFVRVGSGKGERTFFMFSDAPEERDAWVAGLKMMISGAQNQ
jgi:hypothetical protein